MKEAEFRMQQVEGKVERHSDDIFILTEKISTQQGEIKVLLEKLAGHTTGCEEAQKRVEDAIKDNASGIKRIENKIFAGMSLLIVGVVGVLATIILNYTGVIN